MTFLRELARGIDPHLVTTAADRCSMVQDIRRPLVENHVAARMHVRAYVKPNSVVIVHIHVRVHHHDDLGEHELPEAPDATHYFASLLRISLLDCDKCKVVKHAECGQIVVDQLRNHHAHQWQKDAFHRLPHVVILLRWLTDDGRQVDWVRTVRDGGHVKEWKLILEAVPARMVAEWPFSDEGFRGVDVSFDDDFRVGRHFHIDRLTAY